jgi:hypothetical protein
MFLALASGQTNGRIEAVELERLVHRALRSCISKERCLWQGLSKLARGPTPFRHRSNLGLSFEGRAAVGGDSCIKGVAPRRTHLATLLNLLFSSVEPSHLHSRRKSAAPTSTSRAPGCAAATALPTSDMGVPGPTTAVKPASADPVVGVGAASETTRRTEASRMDLGVRGWSRKSA